MLLKYLTQFDYFKKHNHYITFKVDPVKRVIQDNNIVENHLLLRVYHVSFYNPGINTIFIPLQIEFLIEFLATFIPSPILYTQ